MQKSSMATDYIDSYLYLWPNLIRFKTFFKTGSGSATFIFMNSM